MATRRPSRKQARRDALFVLYQLEVTTLPVETLLENVRLAEGYEVDEFTRELVQGVLDERDELDAVLERHSRDWPLSRLAPLERSVLRLALCELRRGDTPPAVVIDEAVRLAKRYATDEAGALVNGILGAIEREETGPSEEGTG